MFKQFVTIVLDRWQQKPRMKAFILIYTGYLPTVHWDNEFGKCIMYKSCKKINKLSCSDLMLPLMNC